MFFRVSTVFEDWVFHAWPRCEKGHGTRYSKHGERNRAASKRGNKSGVTMSGGRREGL